jgi:hypothetical protein
MDLAKRVVVYWPTAYKPKRELQSMCLQGVNMKLMLLFTRGPRAIVAGMFLVIAIVLAAVGSNKIFDAYGIANAEGLTIEQRKENARERQYEWDHRQFNR